MSMFPCLALAHCIPLNFPGCWCLIIIFLSFSLLCTLVVALEIKEIPFETEAQLRIKGTARTPDILLSCPVGVKVPTRRNENKNKGSKNVVLSRENNISTYEWKIVCWIDSKVSWLISGCGSISSVTLHTNPVFGYFMIKLDF